MLLLITRPRYEVTTHYLYHFTFCIIDEARRKNIKTFDLERNKANRSLTESFLKRHNPDIIIFNGHGNDSCIAGQDGEVLIDKRNVDILSGAVVYARACSVGKVLGREIIKYGGIGFIGYTEPFRFYVKKESFHKPLSDDYAQPFFESSNQVTFSLLKGRSTSDAHADSLKVYSRIISRLLVSEAPNSFVIPDLYWNMKHQVCYE